MRAPLWASVIPTVQSRSPVEVVVVGDERLHQWREGSTIAVPGAEFTHLYKRGRWDGTWTPGKWCRMRHDGLYELRCSRGLLPRALASCDVVMPTPADLPVQAFISAYRKWGELRDYQQRAFHAAVVQEWGRIAFATNAGKGAVIALLAQFAAGLGLPVVILCDEKAVFDALQGELQTWAGIEPAVLKAGAVDPPQALVTLAMVPTLARRIDQGDGGSHKAAPWRAWAASRAMVLLDEADKATAPTWRAVLKACAGSRWRLGFSGTFPEVGTYEDWRLEDLMGPILASARNLELVDRGISARPTVTLQPYDASAAVGNGLRWEEFKALGGAGRRQWVYEKAIVYNAERHALVQALIRPDVPTAIVINRIDHGEQLAAAIPGACFLDGSISEGQRLMTLEDFRLGKFSVLVVTKILDRGTNRLGFAQDILFASGEGSNRQTLQRLGRGLRRTGGKEELRLVDIVDHVEVADGTDHASVRLRKLASYLHSAGRSRMKVYEQEGFDVEVAR